MNGQVTPLRVVGGVIVALVLAGLILTRISSGQYILLPDRAHPLASLVRVQNGRPSTDGGAIYYVDVLERPANELEVLFPSLNAHASFYPASDFVPQGTTQREYDASALREMSMSQKIAAAVALKKLGYPVVERANGVLVNVLDIGTPASKKLENADVIQAIDGTPTPTIPKLRARLSRVTPGQSVTLKVLRGNKTLSFAVQTVAVRQAPKQALIGFEPAQSAVIKLPVRISFNLAGVGGPSAGLAFALEVMEKYGKSVTHGHQVVATGEMELDGTIGPIGGVKQKTWGAREAGADVFLVPIGDGNVRDARRNAGPHLRIVPVHTFAQALHALATLPPVD